MNNRLKDAPLQSFHHLRRVHRHRLQSILDQNTMISLRFEGKSDILNALKAEERARGRIRPEFVPFLSHPHPSHTDPGDRFATDLFTMYIQAKLSAGHSKSAVSRKLQDLEQDVRRSTLPSASYR